MPEMDGITVLQQVRPFIPDQRVDHFDVAGTPEKEHYGRGLGVSEFVAKEFSKHNRSQKSSYRLEQSHYL